MLPQELSLLGSSPLSHSGEQELFHRREVERLARRRRARRPPRTARLAARLFGGHLDRVLIAGGDPCASPRLAARAALLTSSAARHELADGLERLLAAAQRPPSRGDVIRRHAAVLANAQELRALAALLREQRPVYARGVAIARLLLIDGTGPAYASRDGSALGRELRRARMAAAGSLPPPS